MNFIGIVGVLYMSDVIVLIILFGFNVLACLYNTCLCFYFTMCTERHKYDKWLWYVSFILSAFVVACDYLFVHTR